MNILFHFNAEFQSKKYTKIDEISIEALKEVLNPLKYTFNGLGRMKIEFVFTTPTSTLLFENMYESKTKRKNPLSMPRRETTHYP